MPNHETTTTEPERARQPSAAPEGASGASEPKMYYEIGEMYGDAYCVTPYDETAYSNEITITLGNKSDSKQWKPVTLPAGAFIAELSVHKEGEKDGIAFVLADVVPGRRLKTSVRKIYGVGLDLDTGVPAQTVDDALEKLCHQAVRYSTHSTGKTKTDIKKDKVMKFAGDREIDQELIRHFLREVERWDPALVDNAEYIGTEHNEQGIVCQITHPPMSKHRIVMLFKEPFDISKEAASQNDAMKKWAKVPEALARLLNVPLDTSCTDPSRLFYLPRHAKGKPFGISLFGGPYLDWRSLELDDPIEKLGAALSKGKSKSVTHDGRELGRWSLKRAHGFQIKDVIDAHAPDRIRHQTGHGYEIECPFDEDHHNPGDQNDRACLVVNAGEGPGEFFTISCRHETCRDKTFLDMLGKMIKDQWFAKSVIDDEQFNAIVEDEEKPEAAVMIEQQDKARTEYEIAIGALTPSFAQAELDHAVALVIKAKLRKAKRAQAQKAMAQATGLTLDTIKDTFNEVSDAEQGEPESGGEATRKSGTDVAVSDGYGNALVFENDKTAIPKFVSYNKETGEIHTTYRNALLLIGSEQWDLGYNELTQNYGLRGNIIYPWPNHLGYALTDAIQREIRLWLLRRWGVTFTMQDVEQVTMTLARRNTFNPVCDYLDDVERKWDGIPRVGNWLETYMGVIPTEENREYVSSVGKIVLVAGARRAREPGCKYDELVIFEGPQGGGKSTALLILAGDWFSDSNLGDLTKRNAPMKLRGVWLQEFGELAAMNKAEVDELKEFMSQRTDRYQPPYGKTEEDFPRRCIFVGTVNPGGGAYLVDLTGNRRFWPITCGEIDLEALTRDRDQLWAEAAVMESRGDSIRLDPSLYLAAKAEQDARLAEDPWVYILADYLVGKTRVTTKELLGDEDALNLPAERQSQTTMKKLKSTMARIPGWEYKASLRVGEQRTAGYEYMTPKK